VVQGQFISGGSGMNAEKVKEIEEKIADLKARWPPHSVRPSMWQELEDLEEMLKKAKEEK
jgi:hypothetical protein